MEIVKNNSELLARKHFLLRAIENKNVNKIEAENEIDRIEKIIYNNTQNKLVQCTTELKQELSTVKQEIKTDGPLKRSIASLLIKFLDQNGFSNDEIKGVMRQGYKIVRYR